MPDIMNKLLILVWLAVFTLPSSAQLRVAAAASLTLPLTEAGKAFEAETGIRVVTSFGASGSLSRQIQQGLPVDLFISANPQWMDALEKTGHIIPETRRNLFGNALVVIVPADSTLTFDHITEVGRIAIGDPASVPAGQYAVEALRHLGLDDALSPRILPAMNVRAALALVARNEVDAGIVYRSDGLTESRVHIIHTFAPETHQPIVYPAALVIDAAHPDLALQWLSYLATEPGAAPFRSAGFQLPAADP